MSNWFSSLPDPWIGLLALMGVVPGLVLCLWYRRLARRIQQLQASRELERQTFRSTETALRESEARFHQLMEHLPSVFWIFGVEEGRMLYISPAYETIFGQSRVELSRKPDCWQAVIYPDDLPMLQEMLKRARTGCQTELEYRVRHPDGALHWVRSMIFPIHDPWGKVYRLGGLSEDITKQVEAERQRQQQRTELAHMSRLCLAGEMASGLAHELNQPLTAIGAYMEACDVLLDRDELSLEQIREVKDRVWAQIQRAGATVQRMKNFTRRTPARPSAVELNLLINEVIQFMDFCFARDRITVSLQLQESLPAVWADPVQVQQVLVNLLANAQESLREQDRSSGRVAVRTSLNLQGQVQVTLTDNGPGLPQGVRERLFEPFFTTRAQGTGLGLAISRTIVEAHQGRLWAADGEEGATFHFTLPVANEQRSGAMPAPDRRGQRAVG